MTKEEQRLDDQKPTDNIEEVEPSQVSTDTKYSIRSLPAWLWAVIAAGVFFTLLVILVFSMALARNMFDRGMHKTRGFDRDGYVQRGYVGDRYGTYDNGLGGPMMGRIEDDNSSSRVSGVVTAVDGDTITVAGNGVVKKIATTSSTNFYGDDKPAKVNDTIVAFGTFNGDTLTASSVRLARQ